MRYTTIIDLSEFPRLYRSAPVRLVYLHLCLRSGYHDHDRDLCEISIRRIAQDTGLSLSAVRCALIRLTQSQMIVKEGPLWHVRKYVLEQPISGRARTERQQKRIEQKAAEEQEREERQRRAQIEEQKRLNLRAQGKTSFMVWYEDMLAKAEAGDRDAQDAVRRHQETYEAHKRSIAEEQAKQSKQSS